MFGKILTVKNDLEIVGAGMTETTIKLWGYVIFAFVIIIFAYRALKYFKKGNTGKVLKESCSNTRIFSSIIYSNGSI